MAKLISSHDHISACFRWIRIRARQKKASMKGAGRYGRPWMMTSSPRSRPAKLAIRCHERQIQHQQRWVNHYQNRLIYERAMLDESGGVVTRTQDFEPGGQVFSRGEWLTIIRVNKSTGR
ncbi:Uncharacterised protein [Escherichia coli]|nr:Uncharacterised protein [Escherichia coli]